MNTPFRLTGRLLFLSEDPACVTAQLGGAVLNAAQAGPLRDDVSTDEITPLPVMVHFDATLGRWSHTGFVAGGLLFTLANLWLSRHGAKHRKRSGARQPAEHDHAGSGLAIALGALIDGIPESLVIGTGIANIHVRVPAAAEAGARTLTALHPGRFVLGLGVSHGPLVDAMGGTYTKPLATMRNYLDGMAAVSDRIEPGIGRPSRLLAALGPKMIELSGTHADGAHPYLVTPEHTRVTRDILGPDKWVVSEQAVVVGGDDAQQLATLLSTLIAEAEMVGKNAGNRESTDDEVQQTIRKFLKNNQEAAAVIRDAGRLAVLERECAVLTAYLPPMATGQRATPRHRRSADR